MDAFKEVEKSVKDFSREQHEVFRIRKFKSQRRRSNSKVGTFSWCNVIDIQNLVESNFLETNPQGKCNLMWANSFFSLSHKQVFLV